MAERLFGVETEYALTALGHDGQPLTRSAVLAQLVELVKDRLPHLRDRRSEGVFLANGGRFYVDWGQHPEMSTPECSNPWEVVRYILAGERILTDLAAELVSSQPEVAGVTLLKCNVDYSGSGSTWGCHESYLHQADPLTIPAQIVPHLVSRSVYAGAGGFNPLSHGLEFTLSPRAAHLVRTVSHSSTDERGIFHTKNESLCGRGYHRLHILCGESLCSHTAAWLRTGTTALVVAMIEAGLQPGDAVRLPDPLRALHRFAGDETCSAAAKGIGAKRLTAVAIQRHYLDMAEAHADEPFMPPWAGDVVTLWRAVLDRLDRGAPDSVQTTLDWAIKRTLYRDWLRQRGVSWDNLQARPALRHKLLEIDARFGQLGQRGIFATMDSAGVLAHRVSGVDHIDDAINTPPPVGRARLRGQCARRFPRRGPRSWADWDTVWDEQRRRLLDLSDPFETREQWQTPTEPQGRRRRQLRQLLASMSPRRSPGRTPEGFCVGKAVLVTQPDSDGGGEGRTADQDWVPDMAHYVGRPTRIVHILHLDERPGHSLVQVDIDGGLWAWRTRHLQPAPDELSALL